MTPCGRAGDEARRAPGRAVRRCRRSARRRPWPGRSRDHRVLVDAGRAAAAGRGSRRRRRRVRARSTSSSSSSCGDVGGQPWWIERIPTSSRALALVARRRRAEAGSSPTSTVARPGTRPRARPRTRATSAATRSRTSAATALPSITRRSSRGHRPQAHLPTMRRVVGHQLALGAPRRRSGPRDVPGSTPVTTPSPKLAWTTSSPTSKSSGTACRAPPLGAPPAAGRPAPSAGPAGRRGRAWRSTSSSGISPMKRDGRL